MLEVDLSYDLSPRYDMDAYGDWAKHSAGIIKSQPGVVHFGGHRNLFGTPRIRTSAVWRSLDDWDKFTKSTDWLLMEAELSSFASNLMVDVRGH